MHFPCKENQLFSGIHALNAFWRNSENVGTSASRCPTSDSSTPPQTSWGKLFFFPLHLWDTLTENIKMQSCLFSFCHYGEVSSIPSVFLKLKPVFFQRQRNCTELSRCLKTPAEIYWFKNLTLKKKKEESHVSEDGKCLSIVNEQFNRADFFRCVKKKIVKRLSLKETRKWQSVLQSASEVTQLQGLQDLSEKYWDAGLTLSLWIKQIWCSGKMKMVALVKLDAANSTSSLATPLAGLDALSLFSSVSLMKVEGLPPHLPYSWQTSLINHSPTARRPEETQPSSEMCSL